MSHACPICGVMRLLVPCYPRSVCEGCASKAVAADGRWLEFSSADISGGFGARYADTGEPYTSRACWIDGVSCLADEARFGGIAIEVTR